MDLKETKILGNNIDQHWYYHSKLDYIISLLGDLEFEAILDVGAGSGFFSKGLLKANKSQVAELMDIGYEKEHIEDVNGKELHYINKVTHSNASLVLMIDIVEHIDDDVAFLRSYSGVVNNAMFIICVPAFNFMWSGHDTFLGHKRRYTIQNLSKTINSAGLKIDRINYYYAGVFPLAFIVRMINKYLISADSGSSLKQHSKTTNAILYSISKLEAFIAKYNKLFGLSIFAVVKNSSKL
ncbi:methyltransferase [Candidatus Woesearchaeota archaeon]|jgi:hypothetical protein|nr:methyltransferase [Candidatus Woesearchaeota archaeon]